MSWKKTQFIGKNVKSLPYHVVGLTFLQWNKTLGNILLCAILFCLPFWWQIRMSQASEWDCTKMGIFSTRKTYKLLYWSFDFEKNQGKSWTLFWRYLRLLPFFSVCGGSSSKKSAKSTLLSLVLVLLHCTGKGNGTRRFRHLFTL